MEWKKLLSPARLGSDEPGVITPERSPFQRDFDRIVFSGAFRRLQNKTQVFPLVKADYVRTRLTHSLETSSIARSLGSAAGVFIRKNFDTGGAEISDIGAAVATAALAHDIGNPPLGHAGEEAIRHWFTHSPVAREMHSELSAGEMSDLSNFEGNAQGFRILTRLEMPDQRGGMQLTCATLGAFVKYPSASDTTLRPTGVAGKKFNFFQSEREFFAEVAGRCELRQIGPAAYCRHPLAFLVEAADDIAYLVVDFEDGARLGMIDYEELERRFIDLIGSPAKTRHLGSISNPVRRAEYLRALVVGTLVQQATEEFIKHHDALLAGEHPTSLLGTIPCAEKLTEIRARSTECIYNHRSVAEIIGAGFEMVSGMLDILVPCVNEQALEAGGGPAASYRARRLGAMLPGIATHSADENWRRSAYRRLMTVLDYISGMTDSYAVSLYQKLKGISL